jgi:DNA mismatch repair protein MutL
VNRIRILPDQVANQIAAGEVIERPASVLKELVENAIDAEAKSIHIEIRGGGKSIIRVQDDGYGMSRDDAMLSLERHATSKIHESADIGAIHTLGFRGEAIPSIASVSRFRILTKEQDSEAGTEIEINGGKLVAVRDAGCAAGTLIEVRNLFFNLPARRKFLRSDATELGHLQHTFLLYAVAQPHLGWTLQQEARTIYNLSPSTSSKVNPQDALLARIKALHGSQLSSQLLPLELRREGIYLRGWIGKPGLSRSNRSELYCFVNSRPVDSRAIYYGLIEGYHTALMRGRYPVCFLFLDIDPASVDVNIHPAKREVRFREDARVQGIVVEAVRKALGTQTTSISASPLPMTLGTPAFRGSRSTIIPPSPEKVPVQSQNPPMEFQNFSVVQPPAQVMTQTLLSPQSIPSKETVSAVPENFDSEPSAILGVFANLYVIAIDSEGLLIIDQHAAHERILFEQMMERLSKGNAPSQRLLLPQNIDLSPNDAVKLKGQLSLLEKMGFGIAEFGDRSFIVDALPPFLKVESIGQLLRQIIDEINESGKALNRDRFAEETVAKTVCRHAVKANDILRTEELKRMISDLKACRHPLTCPHGRPTILRLTQAELEKKFGRRPIEF